MSDAATSEAPRDPWIRFTLIFAALAVLSELIYYSVALESALFRDYLAAVARVSGWILSRAVDGVQVSGTSVTSSLFSVEIGRGCDAYRMCALFSAAVIAFPARVALKAWGIVLGLVWLNLWNFARIVGLFLIGSHAHAYFQRSHEIYFPIVLIGMTVAAWVLWVRRATHERFGESATPA